MNTLFTKTLLWFAGIAVITIISLILAARLNFDPGPRPPRRQPPLGTILSIQLAEARHAYETGGPQELRKTLARFRSVSNTEGILMDAQGRDLVTGADRSVLVAAILERPRRSFFRLSATTLARRSRDGQYIYVLMLNRGNWLSWFLQPELHLTILSMLLVLCYAFARHLTKPVRQLQNAVDCFGRGDLSTRVRSSRRDELGQLARTFDQMADRIEMLVSAERRLLLDISHEFRSPLARLSVAVELARSGADLDTQLDRIQKEADRLNDLVGQLLQVTRAEADPANMYREPVRVEQLVGDILSDAAVEADPLGIRLEAKSLDRATVNGDEELLRRAIENVVRNAIRYTDPAAGVEVEVQASDSTAHVKVRDFGPGVPAEALERIFDPFYRVASDRNRASGGVGLGLAIAKRAVELHRGSIHAANATPGLVVDISIPISD